MRTEEPVAEVVSLGSHVTLEDVDDGLREEFELVSPSESNPAEGRLSVESPVGRAIVGRRRGEVVAAHAPRRIRHLRIARLSGPMRSDGRGGPPRRPVPGRS